MKTNNIKALITGGSSGIGKSTAKILIENNAKVAITGRDFNKLTNTANKIGAIPLHFDVSIYNTIDDCVTEAVKKLGGINVLINNAGIGTFPLLEDIQIEDFEKVFATNVFGLTMLTKAVVKHYKAQKYGDIINVASTASLKGFARGSVYSASKFALRSLTECWRAELRKDNIRVMQINPSEVTTAFNATDRMERQEEDNKLRSTEIAHSILAMLAMDNRGFIPELTVWATNPFMAGKPNAT